ncbi:bactofilin family protein [Stutzerimonas azotifigens]|uniref:bactofilin family protein n=1 Tax=Stutzerimonas azotifigens TaxID=291995 RepID=UPI00042895AF|nr:polymer-forming cytoskeletal protein [Stutzerimonas azotifigens]
MFKKNKPQADLQRFNGKTSVIAADAEVTGNFRFEGAVQVDGKLYGNLATSEGLVRVSHGGFVEGEIRAPFVIIDGQVNGDVHALEHLELGVRARVRGNLFYGLMEMAIGAEVEGRLCRLPQGEVPLELPAAVLDANS